MSFSQGYSTFWPSFLFQIGPAAVIGDQGTPEIVWDLLVDKGHLCKTAGSLHDYEFRLQDYCFAV